MPSENKRCKYCGMSNPFEDSEIHFEGCPKIQDIENAKNNNKQKRT